MCCSSLSRLHQNNPISVILANHNPHMFTCRFRWLINTYTHISVHFIYRCFKYVDESLEAMLVLCPRGGLLPVWRTMQLRTQHHSELLLSGRWGSALHRTAKQSQRVNLDTHAAVFWFKKTSNCTPKRLCYSREEFPLIWDLFRKVPARVVEGFNSSMRQFWNKGVWSAVVSVVRRAVVLIKEHYIVSNTVSFSACVLVWIVMVE